MSDQKENQKGLNIELSEEVAEGVYSNLAIINSGLFFFEIEIALVKSFGSMKFILKFFSKSSELGIGPITFS